MENQSDAKENITIEVMVDNFDIIKDRMNNVNNRIDKALTELTNQKNEWIKEELTQKIAILEAKCSKDDDEMKQLKKGNVLLDQIVNEKKTVIASLELSIKHWLRRYEQVQIENADLSDKCSDLQESLSKAEREIDERQKEIAALQEEARILKTKLDSKEQRMNLNPYQQEHKIEITSNIVQDNFVNVICTLSQVIGTVNKELLQAKMEKEQCMRNLEAKESEVKILAQKLDAVARDVEAREKEALVKNATQAETSHVISHEKQINISDSGIKDVQSNADMSDYTQSTDSFKTISDLQKIIHHKDSTITTLQSDVISKESLLANLQNNLLIMKRELQNSKTNFHQPCDVKKSPSLGW